MASRRLRLKAVINLPVRRGRGDGSAAITDVVGSENPSLSKEINTDAVSVKTDILIKSEVVKLESESATERLDDNIVNKDTINIVKDLDQRVHTDTVSVNNKIPLPKFARKRLNPTVNLPVRPIRKPRENVSVVLENKESDNSETRPSNDRTVVPSFSGITRLPSKSTDLENVTLGKESTTSATNRPNVSSDVPSSGKSVETTELISEEINTESIDPSKPNSNAKFYRPKLVKFKPSPRLVDSTARRNACSTESEEPNSKHNILAPPPSSKSNEIDVELKCETINTVCTATSTGTQPVEKTHLLGLNTLVSNQNTIPLPAESVNSIACSEEPLETDLLPTSKTEKRTTHRRLRKNGVVELLTKARRDFQTKYGNKTPDKTKLTMFDLIFYNPATNPMKITEIKEDSKSKLGDSNLERLAEEKVDDVNTVESDDEDNAAMPAPQVKVGPDGSLIIDEKSLVIETTGSQKRKDELANSAVVMEYGLGNTTYNSFSNKVKSKEWSKDETLKFYRALHSVGTDFLLMQSIFPKRSRKDLKMKFKKEDRLNRDLVDKALRHPLEFDLSLLERDLEQEEKENEKKRHEILLKELATGRKKLKSKERFLIKSLEPAEKCLQNKKTTETPTEKSKECNVLEADVNVESIIPAIQEKRKRKIKKSLSTKEKSIKKKRKVENEDSMSSSSEDELVVYSDDRKTCEEDESINKSKVEECLLETETTQSTIPAPVTKFTVATVGHVDMSSSDDEEVFLKTTQQTRYGRIPQRRILSSEESESEDEYKEMEGQISSDDSCSDPVPDSSVSLGPAGEPQYSVPDLTNVEPGSLVILSTPGQSTFQLFMVGPKPKGVSNGELTHIPVSIPDEMLAGVSGKIIDDSQQCNNPDDTHMEDDEEDSILGI